MNSVVAGTEGVAGFGRRGVVTANTPPVSWVRGCLFGVGQARSVIARAGTAVVVPDVPSLIDLYRTGYRTLWPGR